LCSPRCVSAESQAEWLFVKAKVALAVVIIKNRPSGMSGREHAQDLASKLQRRDESWRKKAEELQQEVLRLRQELLMTRVTPSSTEAADQSNTMDASQDLFGPETAACDLQLGSDSETPDLLLPDVQPTATSRADPQQTSNSETPDLLLEDVQPAATSHQPSGDHRSPPGGATLPHVQFLQSLCALHRVEGAHRGLDSLCGSALTEMQEAAVSAEFRSRVEASLGELTGTLLHSNQLSGD
ncbi:hypothetical protein L3Q82_011412, partial [Scortum barcoo]